MKALFVGLICLILVLLVYFFKPTTHFEITEDSVMAESATMSDSVTNSETKSSTMDVEEDLAESDQAHEAKLETYKQLEKARRDLDRSLSRLKAFLWNVKLPADEAQAINAELLSAHGLLKNKKLMGAFTNHEAMKDELVKVNYSHNKTKEITEQIRDLPKK